MAEPLRSCWAKLDRAGETLAALTTEIEEFNVKATQQIELTHALAPDGMEYSITASGDVVVPARFAVITGEVVHQMRSALDHLICDLVVANGGQVTKQHQYPICSTPELYKVALKKGNLRGLKKSTYAIIEAEQPYTQQDPADTILAVVQDFNNQDKHRLLLVTSSVAALHDQITIGGGPNIAPDGQLTGPNIVGFRDLEPISLNINGARVFSVQFAAPVNDFYVQAQPEFHVAFKQCGAVKNAILPFTMKNILAGVRGTIKLFEGEF
jgi:hypothetical protein